MPRNECVLQMCTMGCWISFHWGLQLSIKKDDAVIENKILVVIMTTIEGNRFAIDDFMGQKE